MISLSTLRADAESLARQLPGLSLQAAAADVIHPGAAGRKRAGSGEQFWQYRRYAQTDAADRIDWRRSARGDEYFVRETELETARTILSWVDPHSGFDWSSDPGRETKADRARIILLALGIVFAKEGERIGLISGTRPASLGKTAPDRLAEDLLREHASALEPPKAQALAIVASDFYDGVESWRARLGSVARTCRHGVLLAVTDPIEHEFPFSGRTRFSRPGTTLDKLFGRAETVRDAYLEKLAAHEEKLAQLATSMGWALVKHRTDEEALSGAAAVQLALEQFGGKA
ncbi:MAG: DUF58 domain-containing protein [Hyphomonadaceae bacterium]|nr:DUF58 domain-containing protein [Hyphomonadaceae bacterium]